MFNGSSMRSGARLILIAALALGLCLLAIGTALASEVIYKSIAPDGEITYARHPDPDALRVETIKLDDLWPEQRRAIARFQQEEINAERDANVYAAALDDKWTRVDDEITRAQAALRKAEVVLQTSREPLPGERRHNWGGGSRLTQAYFDRLHDLELEVGQARQRLDRAYDARNELR